MINQPAVTKCVAHPSRGRECRVLQAEKRRAMSLLEPDQARAGKCHMYLVRLVTPKLVGLDTCLVRNMLRSWVCGRDTPVFRAKSGRDG